jgi:hypothetical protein
MADEKMREIRISLPEELFNFFLPLKTQEHLLQARKEALLAFRALIDARLESLEKKGARKTEAKRKIKIE